MPKLKVFLANLGFYETAVAAPSQRKALEAWGVHQNLFHQGMARVTELKEIVDTVTRKPGTVFVRPVGTKGVFKEEKEAAPILPKLPQGGKADADRGDREDYRRGVRDLKSKLRKARRR